MISGAGATVSEEGVVPLSAKSHHLAREFLDVPQKLFIVHQLVSARERGGKSR
jgi:hypothetical protein